MKLKIFIYAVLASSIYAAPTAMAQEAVVIKDPTSFSSRLSELNAAVRALKPTVQSNSVSITITKQKLDKIQACALGAQIHNEGSIAADNPNGCEGLPPDPAELAQALACTNGDILKQVAGTMQCVNPMEGCRIVSRQEHLVTRHVPKVMSNAVCIPSPVSSWAGAPVQKTLATYNSATRKWDYTGAMQNDYVVQTGSHWVGSSNLAKAIVANCGQSGLFGTIPYQHTTYRDEHTFSNATTKIVCN